MLDTSSATVTNVVERLVERSLLTRVQHPTDRRAHYLVPPTRPSTSSTAHTRRITPLWWRSSTNSHPPTRRPPRPRSRRSPPRSTSWLRQTALSRLRRRGGSAACTASPGASISRTCASLPMAGVDGIGPRFRLLQGPRRPVDDVVVVADHEAIRHRQHVLPLREGPAGRRRSWRRERRTAPARPTPGAASSRGSGGGRRSCPAPRAARAPCPRTRAGAVAHRS